MSPGAWQQYALTGGSATRTCGRCGATTKQPHRDRWWWRWTGPIGKVGRYAERLCQACAQAPREEPAP